MRGRCRGLRCACIGINPDDSTFFTVTPNIERFHAQVSEDPLRDAYRGRSPVIPWMAYKPVKGEDIAKTWERMCRTPRSGKAVAYVHVPFCSNHCLFCNFYRNATRRNTSGPYVDALIREIEREANTVMARSAPVHAVYLGGGTPSDLEAGDLARLIECLRHCLPLASDCEITVEGRATGFSFEKITACLDAGANRFSFGVQTFDTAVRKRLGRKMAAGELVDFLCGVCALDRATVVCDLIFGLPDQNAESWQHDIEICERIGIDGVDLYALTVFPSSPLAAAIRKGSLPAGAEVRDQGPLYAMGVEMLENAGWRQLTNAHFSRQTRERNLYNQLIKAGADCLAYGAGAGGMAGDHSYMVAPDLTGYQERNASGQKPLGGIFEMGWGHVAKAVATEGVEIGRLDPSRVDNAGVAGFAEAIRPLAMQWEQAGLVCFRDEILRLTLAGRFWHTNLTSSLHHLIDALNPASSSAARPTQIPARPSKTPPIPMKATDAIDHDKQTRIETLRAKFAKDADGILEMIAMQSGLATREVVECLPESCMVTADGEHFARIMDELSEWGEILLIVHTPDAIIECAAPLPKGSFGRGFFNLGHGSPIRGHIRAERCADICLVRRPFMGMETCSVQFFNAHGDAMFKIFVSRDANDKLNETQVARFEALREQFRKPLAA